MNCDDPGDDNGSDVGVFADRDFSNIEKQNNIMPNNKEVARFSLAGVQYSDYQLCAGLKANSPVTFTWERSNTFDPMAIRVDYHGTKIGYVPKGPNQDLLHELREDNNSIQGSVVAFNRNNPTWHMITIKVEAKQKTKKEADVRFK